MGRITQKTIDRKEVPKPSRKRRKKELDRIHSKILKARGKLDNVGKGNIKGRQRKQSCAKICNRLLPKLDTGIYRNGTKGKNIQKAETSKNIFDKARLNADALKLFNGDTPKSNYSIIEISSDDEAKKSSNTRFVKHSLDWTPGTLEQSPILRIGQCQNQRLCVKKKAENNAFQKSDPNNIGKPKIKDELTHAIQKDVCKRRLFQNDKEQSTNKVEAITTQSQICDNTNRTKDNKVNEKKIEQNCSKNGKNKSWDPVIRYMEFCKIMSAENFESDCLQNYQSDLVTTTIQKLRHAYTDTFRLQLLREKNKQGLTNVESPAVSVEYQACTTSNVSQFSPIEFEVPKCTENHTITTRLQGVSQKNKKSYFMQNAELQESSGVAHSSSTSCSAQNTSTMYNTNSLIMKNHEDNENQCAKQSSSIRQLSRPVSFCFVNEKSPIHLDSQILFTQRISKHISHPSKNNKDNFHIDIPGYKNAQCVDNAKFSKNLIFKSDSVLPAKGHLSKDYFEKLSADNYPSKDTLPKCNDKINMKNVKRVPTILRRCNVIINKNNHSVQINDDSTDLHKKSAINLFNKTPDQDINKEFYETEFPNMFKKLATPSTINRYDRSKLSQSGLMEMNDQRESQVDEFDINMCSNKLNRRNGFSRFDKSLQSQAFETSYDTNAYSEKSSQREIASNMRKHLHSNYRPINYLQRANFLNIDVESAKQMQQTTEQAKLHARETNNARDQNQNILFNDVNDRVIPTAILSFSQNVQTDKKRESTCEKAFNVNCMKNQTNTCRCNEQCIYFDSTHCPHKYNTSQMHHFCENVVQPKTSYDMKNCNNDTNNYINQSSGMRNIPLLPMEQKQNPCMYLKVTDEQHRAILLQNVTQPVKYLAIKNDSGIQRIPIYINDGNVKVAENVPLKVVTLVDSNTQPKTFPQEVVPQQVIPLRTNNLQLDDFTAHKTSNQFVIKHLNPMNTILLNPDSQSSIWYTSNL